MFLYRCIAAVLLCTPFLNAEESLQQLNERLTVLEQRNKERQFYNSPTRPVVSESFNLFLTGDLLYLKAQEGGMEYAVSSTDPAQVTNNDQMSVKNLHFQYDFGFRAGLGYRIPHDSWDLYLNWMNYSTDTKRQTSAPSGGGLFPIWSSTLTLGFSPAAQAKAHWNFTLNIIDGEVRREYYLGKKLTIRPSLGIRTAWVDQKFKVDYIDFAGLSTGVEVKMTNNYSGIGPKAQVDSHWMLGAGFSIYGSAALSLLYGEFEIRKREKVDDLPTTITLQNDFHLVRALADLGIGLAWGQGFLGDKFFITLALGWEEHLFFGQNQLIRLFDFDDRGSLISNLGDLGLQGGVFSIRLDF